MKVAVGRAWDLAKALATKAGNDLKDVLEQLMQFQDSVIRLTQNNITIDDNLNCERKRITYSPGQVQYDLIGLKSPRPAHIMLGEAEGVPITNPFTFSYRYDGRQGKTQIYLKPLVETSTKVTVELIILYR